MTRWIAACWVLILSASVLMAGDEALKIRKELKGSGGIEKVVVLEGKEAVYAGKGYDAVVVLTVTTRFAALQGDALQDFRKDVLGVVRRHLKGGNSVVVIQSEKELTYEAWPF